MYTHTPKGDEIWVADEQVQDLVTFATSLGLEPEDLDETVYLWCDVEASKMWGNYYPEDAGEDHIEDDMDDDEVYHAWLHERTDAAAAEINTCLEGQVAFLVWYLEDHHAVKDILEKVANDNAQERR